jgi:hypothetical protein
LNLSKMKKQLTALMPAAFLATIQASARENEAATSLPTATVTSGIIVKSGQ